jgi:hypothetical protein|nr:hypothetical protein [Sulfobacillus thermosulfidooxidans]
MALSRGPVTWAAIPGLLLREPLGGHLSAMVDHRAQTFAGAKNRARSRRQHERATIREAHRTRGQRFGGKRPKPDEVDGY